jgi:Holliday junction resolvase RusA-like endonuclease
VKPKSWKKSDNEPFKRPDVDNYGKLLLDALNDYAIPDDSQVIHLDVWKLFSSQPHIEFRVWKYEA